MRLLCCRSRLHLLQWKRTLLQLRLSDQPLECLLVQLRQPQLLEMLRLPHTGRSLLHLPTVHRLVLARSSTGQASFRRSRRSLADKPIGLLLAPLLGVAAAILLPGSTGVTLAVIAVWTAVVVAVVQQALP